MFNPINNLISADNSERKNTVDNYNEKINSLLNLTDRVSISNAFKDDQTEKKLIKINYLTQDPSVMEPVILEVSDKMIGKNLENDRLEVYDRNNPIALPDLEGNYLFESGSAHFDQVGSLASASKTIEMLERYRGSGINWAFGDSKLTIVPRKQEGKNAYYSRNSESANFFYFYSDPLKKTVQISESADVVSHELAHASLDGLRPNYLGWDLETTSFHEAFADITSMLYALESKENIKKLFEENKGDFKKESLISRLGEEFGKALHLEDDKPENDGQLFIRNMINDFKYVNPNSLPSSGSPDSLIAEPHSFSRVLSGAFYSLIEAVYNKNLATNSDPQEALIKTKDTVGKLLMRSIDNAPQTKCKYKDFAISMIKADKSLNNSDNYEEMKNIFLERKLITSSDLNNIKNFPLKGLEIKEDLKDPGTYEKFINDNAKVFDLTEDTPLRTASISFNEDGNITVGVIMTKEIQLKGSEFGKYENCWVDVHGGVTLILDKNGKLLDIINDRIDEKKIKDVMNGLNNSIKKDLILEPFKSYFKDENTMYEGICDHLADGRKKIYRLPVIFN